MDYVLRRDHQTHRRDRAELILLADKVEAAHANSPDGPDGRATCLVKIEAELESQMLLENTVLFPRFL